MLLDDREGRPGPFQNKPTGPWSAPPRAPTAHPSPAPQRVAGGRTRRPIWSAIFFALLVLGVGIRAYRDLSRPEAWDYWRESYLSPSITSSLIAKLDLDGANRGRPALAISGKIGAASASWLRERLDEAHLSAGDVLLLSSPGGDLDQALIMGEIIRSRGLATAVGTADASGRLTRSYCASACVLLYAGGTPRYGVEGSALGVHRFTATLPSHDPVADAQRTTGMVLSYMTKMGVSSAVVEAMSATRDVRWLSPTEALTMNLTTGPIGKAEVPRR
ncbi:hypothetical protein [Bradyrhizobium sp.]|uniref:hypothetical protein n=1 Tax=Bradyrhizobium sp. TaxID=376 RepID=UPI003BAF2EA2